MSTPAKEANANAFTQREHEIMALAWQCFEGEPKVDYSKLAGLCGMSNPTSASNAWAKIKKKLAAQAEAAGGDGGASPTKKATPKATPKRKKKADADGDDEEPASPTKKAKTPKSGGKGKAKKSEEKVEEDGDEAGAEAGEGIKVEEKDELS